MYEYIICYMDIQSIYWIYTEYGYIKNIYKEYSIDI